MVHNSLIYEPKPPDQQTSPTPRKDGTRSIKAPSIRRNTQRNRTYHATLCGYVHTYIEGLFSLENNFLDHSITLDWILPSIKFEVVSSL